MRVIGGTRRSLPLKSVPGNNTRPTTDRIKETLFNMLNPYLTDCLFLDLFSGSGGIGIEALSRGAKSCVFVEQNKTALCVIRENLKFTKLEEQAVVLGTEARTALNQLQGKQPFDIIFMDPPYNQDLEKEILLDYQDASFISPDTLIVVEASLQTDFSWAENSVYEIRKIKKYKTNVHVFLQKKPED